MFSINTLSEFHFSNEAVQVFVCLMSLLLVAWHHQ